MSVLEVVGGIGTLGFAVTSVFLAIRNGGLRAEVKEADLFREDAQKQLAETARKFADYRSRAEKQIAELMGEIDELEDQEGAAIAAIDDPAVRRARRRARVARLLSTTAGEGGERDGGMPDESTTRDEVNQ